MLKTFNIISIGPGNPELVTIQALKALINSEIIFVPNRSENPEWDCSVTYKILNSLNNMLNADNNELFSTDKKTFTFMDKLYPLYTPMNYDIQAWFNQVEIIAEKAENFTNMAYVTLGDASISSSVYYILEIIKQNHTEIFEKTKIISGITSFSYASSTIKKPLSLGDIKLEILPADNAVNNTKVYMRLPKSKDLESLEGDNLYYFKNLGFENESYGKGKPENIDNYLTLLIDFAEVNSKITNREHCD